MARKKARPKVRLAVLNQAGVLVDCKEVDEDKVGENDIPIGDLPVGDAAPKYKFRGGQFIPLDHGYGKPEKPPIPSEQVLWHLAKQMGDDAPLEVKTWCTWYEKHRRQRGYRG